MKSKQYRCYLFFVIFFVIFLGIQVLLPMTGAAQERISLDMTNLGKAWEEFKAKPGPGTATKLYELLPDGKTAQEIELQTEVRELIAKELHALESRIYAGEREALRVAFRLFTIADVEMQKSLIKIVGYLLRFNTRLFLEELITHEELVPDLELLVCSFRLSAPDDNARQKLEKNIRLKALSYIDDKKLKSIKKKCTKILKKVKLQ